MPELTDIALQRNKAFSPRSDKWCRIPSTKPPGGAITLPDFWSLAGNPSDSSPAPVPVFARVLALLGLPGSSVFDKLTAATFGQANDTWLSYPDRVGLNVLLQAITVKEIAREHHLSKDRVIRILSLRDELAVIAAHRPRHCQSRPSTTTWPKTATACA